MEHELNYDEKNQVLVLRFKNDLLYDEVKIIAQKLIEITHDKPYKQLIVVSGPGYKIENRETREAIMSELSNLNFTQLAYVGLSAANRMIAKVMSKTGLIKLESDFFSEYEEAAKWLKSKR